MNLSLKKIILTLVGISLLCSFQASASSDFYQETSAILDTSSDAESSENENCELENFKFFNSEANGFRILKISLRLENKDNSSLQKNFTEVPTSPPNA